MNETRAPRRALRSAGAVLAGPLGHALAFGAVGVVLSIAGAWATWNRGPEFGPKWYALAVIAIALPCAFLGGQAARVSRGTSTVACANSSGRRSLT